MKMTEVLSAFDDDYAVLDVMPAGVFLLKRDYTVLFWNKCLEHWTKINKDTIVGTNIKDHFPQLDKNVYSARLENIFDGGPPTIFSSQLHKNIIPALLPDGHERIQHTIVTALQSKNTNGFNALFVVQDVSDLSRRIQDYRALSKELKKANEELEAFIYTVSHDLRAPLRAVIGFARILEKQTKGELTLPVQQTLDIITSSASEMNNLIDDLLTLSRIGRKTLNKQVLCIKDMVTRIIGTNVLKYEIEQRKLTVIINPMPDFHGDPGLIKQVFINLITNAIKFTRKRQEPVIEVGSKLLDNRIVLYVKDNGIGFDSKFADKIFDVFQRLHSGQEDYEGTGAGLAIVRRIIACHHGEIWADSEKDSGATFYFYLPGEENGVARPVVG